MVQVVGNRSKHNGSGSLLDPITLLVVFTVGLYVWAYANLNNSETTGTTATSTIRHNNNHQYHHDNTNDAPVVRLAEEAEGSVSHSSSSSSSTTPSSSSLPDGWKPIHIFTGSGMDVLFDREDFTKKFQGHNEQNPKWSGQIQQDRLVYELLGQKRHGYFIELASNDAIYLSNSFSLEQYYGWKGICVEGNPQYWFWLAFRNCHVVGALAGGRKGETIRVNFDGAETGGIVGLKTTGSSSSSKTEPRQTTTLLEILDSFRAPRVIDYLSLDVEGSEEMIMKHFDFDKYQFTLMTVERPSGTLQQLLKDNGYEQLRMLDVSFGESLWKHSSAQLPNEDGVLDEWCRRGGKCSPKMSR